MIILDTSFIASFYNIRDENHKKATEIMREIVKGKYGPLYITDYIFDESVTIIFIRLKNLDRTIEIGETLRKSTEIIDVEKLSFEHAWKFFKEQEGTKFSFTDCTTISVMQSRNIKSIATFDKDFQKIKEINVVQ